MRRRSRCIWPPSPAQGQDESRAPEASLADCRAPAAPLAAAADHFPIGIAPAAAPSPSALLGSRKATRPVVGRAVGMVARSVVGAGASIGPGNAEPEQGADRQPGR